MKEKIATIVCGNSGIDYIKHPYSIDVFRSILFIDEEEYTDFIDITADAFYKRINLNPDIDIKTSQTSTGDMLEVYKRLETEGYTNAIVITVSSRLSGTYQNAILAADMAETLKVSVFDSRGAAYPEAKLALVCAEMAKNGHSVSEILAELEHIRSNSHIYFIVETLKFLVKNGRLSVAKGFLGNLFKLKPLLWVNEEGVIETLEKIRTSKKALERLKEKFFDETKDIEIDPFVLYTIDKGLAEDIAAEIKARYPYIKDIPLLPLTPVVGAHSGPGTYAIGYIKK
ncbi:MAG TPA: DegV family protein [Bacilli bacterium]|nr:DegV family protein [Bacilli bacterium]